MKITSQQLIQRMMAEGIPEDQANRIGKHSGSVQELKMRIRSYLEDINADNVNNKIRRILCKS